MEYSTVFNMLSSLINDESDAVTIMSNASALIFGEIDRLNWAGFYRVKNGELLLGPFQGKVACMHIPFDKGVCGHAYRTGSTTVVDDVHSFPGHIACDCDSLSEIVVPLKSETGEVFALLDIDSPVLSRFGDEEIVLFEKIAALIESKIH